MTQGPHGSQQPDPWSPEGQNWSSPEPRPAHPDRGNPNWSEPSPAWQPPSPDPVQGPYQPNPYQPNPYPAARYAPADTSWGAPPSPAEQHSIKGVVAIWLVGAAIVISFILSWLGGRAIIDLYHLTGTTLSEGGDYPDTSATEGPLMRFGLTILLQAIPSGLGLAGLIVGAMGIRYRNAKALGIVSLILAVLAPFISFGVLIIAAGPAL